jgi:prolyl oligopeptidase
MLRPLIFHSLCLAYLPIAAVAQSSSTESLSSVSQPSETEAAAVPLTYPKTKKVDVVDTYHDIPVADPYRWLEDTESKETEGWVEAQNEVTQAYLKSLPGREEMRQRLEKLWNYERYGLPRRRGERYFYSHNDGLQNQSILYKAASLDAPREVLIDPNTLSDDGTVALAGSAITEDGSLIAYALADGGSDWRTWKVRDVETGKDLQDTVRWVKFSGIAWLPDNSGFFYSRYAEPVEGDELTGTNENQRMYFHKLGTSQDDDQLVIARPDQPKWGFSPIVTDDGRFLVIQNWKGSEPQSQVFLKDLQDPDGEIQPLITGFDAEYDFIASVEETLYFLTDHEAPRRRVISVSAKDPARENWNEVVAETSDVIQSVSLFGETFYVNSLRDARSRITRHAIDGDLIAEFDLPGLGSVGGFGGRQDAKETFFQFTNYVTPGAIYRVDLSDASTELWRQSELAIDTDDFVTEQVFCTSKDGTKIPIIITRRKDSPLDGSNQTLLYAYGGFNISLTPSFSPANAAWVDAGGVYAVANLRGGGEYGRQWHEAGMRLNKQNVFDDFIAAAEHLIDAGYTTKNRLGIRGGSNGGLLVGAVMTQRPDLFGACLPAVGVMDMLRYQKFTIGWAWVTEFGSSDEADQIENLLSYSPLHNLEPGTCYPATLITTADRDDRVVPGHSFKFAAALQAAQSCENPTLIRIETRAGHGAGTPVSKRIDEYTDLWTFLQANLVE